MNKDQFCVTCGLLRAIHAVGDCKQTMVGAEESCREMEQMSTQREGRQEELHVIYCGQQTRQFLSAEEFVWKLPGGFKMPVNKSFE